jgi:hypothetical protein
MRSGTARRLLEESAARADERVDHRSVMMHQMVASEAA